MTPVALVIIVAVSVSVSVMLMVFLMVAVVVSVAQMPTPSARSTVHRQQHRESVITAGATHVLWIGRRLGANNSGTRPRSAPEGVGRCAARATPMTVLDTHNSPVQD